MPLALISYIYELCVPPLLQVFTFSETEIRSAASSHQILATPLCRCTDLLLGLSLLNCFSVLLLVLFGLINVFLILSTFAYCEIDLTLYLNA